MKATITTPILVAAFALVAAPRLHAQATNQLQVYTAIEIVYQTEVGKTYTLQGSVDLMEWTDIGNPVLGNGQIVDRIFSTKNAGTVNYASYRLNVGPGPTNGYAPWSIDGVTLQMDDSSASNIVQYLTTTNGHDVYLDGDDTFSYKYSRTSANGASLERTYSPDRFDNLTYAFSASGAGSWVREGYEKGVLKNRSIGAFHYVSTGTNSTGTNPPPVITPTQPPAPPNSLTGLVYYAFTGPVPDKYQFNTTGSGVATPGTSSGEVETTPTGNIFTYAYNVLTSNTASLTVNFGYYGIGGDRQEYDLTFNDGPSGLFNRRIYRLGSLFTTDHGVFSPYSILTPPSATNNPPGITNAPPSNPAGLTYTINIGEIPPRLVFKTPSTGIEFDDSAPSDFSFTYTSTDPNTFNLVVRFKPDRWDEYTLSFSNGAGGTTVRKQYRKSQLDRTDSGSFSLSVNSP